MNRRIVNLHDVEAAARRKLPAMIYDYIAGASHEEHTRDRNRTAFMEHLLTLRSFVDVSQMDMSTTMLGVPMAAPVFVAPMGLLGGFHPDADLAAARAASERELLFMHSAKSGIGISEVARIDADRVWAQLSFLTEEDLLWQHIADARKAGVSTLILMGDVGLGSKRDRDYHHGLDSMPPRFSVKDFVNTGTKPGWVYRYLTGRPFTWGNYRPGGKAIGIREMIAFEERNRVPSVDWDDVRRVRDAWPGKLVIKGIMNADDARTAVHDIGADALYVSNHGGRQLDSQPATIEALPRIRAAVEGKAEVYLDGGVRRGEDALKALALGARAVGLARPVAYGLAAAGQKGVGRALDIMMSELRTVAGLTGTTKITQVDESIFA